MATVVWRSATQRIVVTADHAVIVETNDEERDALGHERWFRGTPNELEPDGIEWVANALRAAGASRGVEE